VKEDGCPFKIVFERIKDTSKVIKIPNNTIAVRARVDVIDWKAPPEVPPINMVPIAISVGNRPLQGTKTLVRVAINLSLGDSIILQPITPAALQPKPMHMVKQKM